MKLGGHEVDVGGRGPTTKTTYWIIHLSVLLQTWTPDVSMIEITCADL